MGRVLKHTVAGLLVLGALTLICYQLHLTLASAGFLYLAAVVVQSLVSGFAAAALISIAATAALAFFFTEPVFSLQIDDPLDVIALVMYTSTALVISRLSARAQQNASIAQRNENEMRLLYASSLQLLSLDPEVAEEKFLGVFQRVFGFTAIHVCESAGRSWSIGADSKELKERTLHASNHRDEGAHSSAVSVRCFQADRTVAGAIGFEGVSISPSVAGSLSVITAMVLDRARSFRLRTEAAAESDAESLRSAILDGLAHEFKGPLATTLVATESLAEAGALNEKQKELAELVGTQTARLNQLTNRLLRTARLDKEEIHPQIVRADLSRLLREVINGFRAESIRIAPTLHIPIDPVFVLVDPELLGLALLQLIDNAFKYSGTGSAITISLEIKAASAELRVRNRGSAIAPEEKERIFERFYRGKQMTAQATGSGLGLYVSRKIVTAHDGSLELELDESHQDTATFCLRLKLAETGSTGIRRAG